MREPLERIKTLQQHAMGQLRLNALTMLSSEKEFSHGLLDLKRGKVIFFKVKCTGESA